jgi:hypothetical protein
MERIKNHVRFLAYKNALGGGDLISKMPLGSVSGKDLFLELPGSSAVPYTELSSTQEVEDDDNLGAVTCGYRCLVMWEEKLSLILLLIFSLKHKAALVGPCPM